MSQPGNGGGMLFDRETGERTCGNRADPDDHRWEEYGGLACMRTSGHQGECISACNEAAAADGVRHCCRVPLGAPHAARCTNSQP